MEEELRKIMQFANTSHCIFEFDLLDYPTFFQQRFITSYIFIRKTLGKPHAQIVRELHSVSEKTIDQVAQGFLYCCLLEEELFQHVLQYLMIFRVEIWIALTRNLEVMLSDCLDTMKIGCRKNLGPIIAQILSYNVCTPELIEVVTKTISNYDFRHEIIASNKSILTIFISFLKDTESDIIPEIRSSLAHFLLLKAVRLLTSPYHEECVQLILLIKSKFHEQCRFISEDICEFMLPLLKAQKSTIHQMPHLKEMEDFLIEVKEMRDSSPSEEMEGYRLRVLGILLQKRMEGMLHFITAENLNYHEIKFQIEWIEKQWHADRLNPQLIIFDIMRWLIAGSDFFQVRVMLLEWLVRRAASISQDCFMQAKRIISSPIFRKNVTLSNIVTCFSYLKKIMQVDQRLASEIFVHIIERSEEQNSIKNAFLMANTNGILKMEQIEKNPMVPEFIKKELSNIIIGFNPSQMQSEEEVVHVIREKGKAKKQKNEVKVDVQIKSNTFQIVVEDEFVHLFGNQLTDVLDAPTYPNFIQFFSKVCEAGVAIRKDKENKHFADKVCREAARVIFTLFNKQFQDFNELEPYQTSVIFHMLSIIGQEWARVTHRLEIIKGVVKKLIQLYPVAEVSFWMYFFTYFQYGGTNYRNVKNWLVAKEKTKFVIPAIEILTGKEDKGLRERAATYGIQ